jgi:predicted TIM-barrel fold metal-dependent hydrolase
MHPLFDSHFHIIDPAYPLIENRGFYPEPFLFEDYVKRAKDLHIQGGAVVSGSYHGFDQTYIVSALKKLGSSFVGVTQLPFETPEEEITRLHQAGIRAIRFNIYNGLIMKPSELESMAKRVYEIAGWHVDLHIQSSLLDEYTAILEKLPAVTIDHLGLTQKGFDSLLRFVEKGVKVKASGFGRLNFDVSKALKSIYAVNPDALMFGTDLPSTRAKRPFQEDDIELIYEALGEKGARKVLYSNAVDWYRF